VRRALLLPLLVLGACDRYQAATSSAPDASRPSAVRSDAGRSDAGGSAEVVAGPNIVVDQFGYRTADEKIAVVRSPESGFDRAPYTPGATLALVDARTGARVFEAAPVPWNGGAVDPSSGDRAWWFDFSTVTTPGEYAVLDVGTGARSPRFRIADDVYRHVLVQAVRTFYYQRDGTAKDAAHAGPTWADGMAHAKDASCGLYSDGSAPRDLHGGWFDAGDQNRYTVWAAADVIELLRAYAESPRAFGDDTNIPESGNGVADLVDEVKWELDWMTRMQNADGAVLSVAAHEGASPPSADRSPCKYGPPTTAASLASAAAFAYASMVLRSAPGVSIAYPGLAEDLASRAQRAWTWAAANPAVVFRNSGLVAGGEQEVDDDGRARKKLQAAAMLFALTGDTKYRTVADVRSKAALAPFDPFHAESIDAALEYARARGATPAVVEDVRKTVLRELQAALAHLRTSPDPYLAYLHDYTWGSNQVKAMQGNLFADVPVFTLDPPADAEAMRAAQRYAHYLHGVNPLGLVYLSNMEATGATRSVTRFYHTWFAHGSKWDAHGVSAYGPPPGFLVGGPNPEYSWDACCPSKCGSRSSNDRCGAAPLSPPAGQPAQKAYRDFNDGWPLDSWAVSENDVGYQAHYVRLLSKLVP
jgi:hypothetical protein